MRVGFLLADDILLRVARWSLEKGSYPYPKGYRCMIGLVESLLVLYDEANMSLIVRKFSLWELGFVRVWLEGDLSVMEEPCELVVRRPPLRSLPWTSATTVF